MLAVKDVERYRQVIQEAVADLGRDDVGVGEVRVGDDGVLAVELRRGTHSDVREISVEALQNRETAHQAVMKAIRPLTKEVEQDVMRTD